MSAAVLSPFDRLRALIESSAFKRFIIALIVVNATILGLETSPPIMAAVGPALEAADQIILAVFVVEILAKLAVYRRRALTDGWTLFDIVIVGVSLLPASGGLSILRALRVLRVLRMISVAPSLRRVVQALLDALPGMGSVAAILALIYYVAGVMATKLFGEAFPEWFGTLGASMYTLFQVMTLESWSMGIVRPVMDAFPWAWMFFVPYIVIATFCVLNLFIAIIVSSMQELQSDPASTKEPEPDPADLAHQVEMLRAELRAALVELRRPAASDADKAA